MGEIAEMMLDGTLDYETGEYLGEGEGYPRTARNMRRGWGDVFPKGCRRGRKPKDTKCPACDKMMRGQDGLRAHTKAVHGARAPEAEVESIDIDAALTDPQRRHAKVGGFPNEEDY